MNKIVDPRDEPLTHEQKRLVNAFMETNSRSEAARTINKSQSWAFKQMAMPHVQHEVEMRQQDAANRADVTNRWLIEEIKDTAMKAKNEGSWSAALKGLEMLGKVTGLFDEANAGGTTYNVMGSVVLAPDAESAQKLLSGQNGDVMEGDYTVLDFNIGEDVEEK